MKKKSNTLSNIFAHYPHKKRHKKNCTRPLTKGWEYDEDNELSMNWSEWYIFMKIYLKHTRDYLLSGKAMILPNQMGILRMYKYKYPNKKAIDFNHYNKTGEKVYFQNNQTNGYGPVVKWHRKKYQGSLRRKWYWMIRLNRKLNPYLYKLYTKDPALLYSYNDVPTN